MKEISMRIPDGTRKVTVEIGDDGEAAIRYEKPEVNVEEKFHPKDGDILYGNSLTENIVIYKGTNERGAILSYAGMTTFLGIDNVSVFQTPSIGYGLIKDYIRPATEAEKQRLFDALAKKGKRWNADKKCIEDLPRWRAKANETYYFIAIDVEVMDDIEDGGCVDDACYSVGNYFKTREAAERVAKQIREIFKNSKAE